MNAEPIWRMVQDCARELTRQGKAPFSRKDLIACIQQCAPKCEENSINPIIQGVTDNLKGGAPGADGKKILHSVSRGRFVLYSKKDDRAYVRESLSHHVRKSPVQRSINVPTTITPSTENALRDYILDILKTNLVGEQGIELIPERRRPYTLPDGHTLHHASDILAHRNGGEKYVSIELKYKSAVTDQFKCRSYDAMHMKREYSNRMLCVMLFVKANAGVSIGQAEKICHPFDRFIGVPVAEIGDSSIWKGLADEISTFL